MFIDSSTELNKNFEFCLKVIRIPNWVLILVPKLSKTCLFYCETRKSVKTRNIYGMLSCCEEKANKSFD